MGKITTMKPNQIHKISADDWKELLRQNFEEINIMKKYNCDFDTACDLQQRRHTYICECCNTDYNTAYKSRYWHTDDTRIYMHIEHCHTTGKIRGVVCPSCNITIGYIENQLPINYNRRVIACKKWIKNRGLNTLVGQENE